MYALIVEDGGALVDRAEVREKLDRLLAASEAQAAKTEGRRRPIRTMSLEQAMRMEADAADYDAKAAKGLVSG